jgi:hypothetical protein
MISIFPAAVTLGIVKGSRRQARAQGFAASARTMNRPVRKRNSAPDLSRFLLARVERRPRPSSGTLFRSRLENPYPSLR